MNKRKSLLTKLAETFDQERAEQRRKEQLPSNLSRLVRWFLPNGGTVVIVVLLIASQSIWSVPWRSRSGTSTSTITYQGRLTDPDGIPLTGQFNMVFRLYDGKTGGTSLWEEDRTGGIRCSFRMDS